MALGTELAKGEANGSVGGFGLGLILAMEVPNLFSAPLPSKFTIATFSGGGVDKVTHTTRWIRSGEIEGVLQAILLGVGGSMLTKSAWPFILVMGMVCWKVWSYEDALRRGVTDGPGIDMQSQPEAQV